LKTKIFSFSMKNALPYLLQRWHFGCKFKSRRIGSRLDFYLFSAGVFVRGAISPEVLTFHPEVRGAADAVWRHQIAGALAGVVGVVDDPVQLGPGPLVHVEVEGRADRLEVVLGKVRRLLPFAEVIC
jgi:hypothetical protein